MQSSKDTFLNNRWKRILIVALAFPMMYVVSYIMNPFAPYWATYFTRPVSHIVEDWVINLIFCLFVSEGSIIISNRLNKKIPWTESPDKRFAWEAGLNLLLILLIHAILTFYCMTVEGGDTSTTIITNEEYRDWLQWIVITSMFAFLIVGINTGNYIIVNWKNAAIRATELNQVAMEAELQSLKLQIDPHFVFNNLSVLSELILEDQQLGYDYAENFSRIYRYLLLNSKKNTILLEEELKFLHSYMFLIQHRFGEGVNFTIDVDNDSKQLSMPPLTLQLLVENALKHNRTSKKEPLNVCIYTTDNQELIVENALLPIEKPLDSSGIGIKNIVRRYDLLSEKGPKIIKSDASFKVIIPLIKI
jgi:two-component system, LytTR family, sensor kinase